MQLVKMTAYRLTQLLVVALAVSLAVFLLIRLIPGDPVDLLAGFDATPEQRELLTRHWGLDQPLHMQYASFLGNLLQGDMGRSLRSGRAVVDEVVPAYRNTIKLTVVSMTFATVFGILAGVVASTRPYSLMDTAVMGVAVIGASLPVFWVGLVAIVIFAVNLGWFPSAGMGTPAHYVLPALTLGLYATALIARMTRTTMIEVLSTDYVRTARGKGVSERGVVFRHAIKNAMIPVVTVIGLQFGYLLAGAVLTETVFAWPGLGRLVVSSIVSRDYPVVQVTLILVAVTYTVVNMATDLVCEFLDPRLRYD